MEYNKSKEKSITEIKFEMNGKNYITNVQMLKNTLRATFLAGAVSVIIGAGIISLGEKAVDNKRVEEMLRPYYEIVYHNKHNQFDERKGHMIHYYSNDNIAITLLEESEDFEEKLYGIYSKIGYNQENKIKQMNEIVAFMKNIIAGNPEGFPGFTAYIDFEDYLAKKGFVDRNGNVKFEDYEKYMNELLALKAQIKGLEEGTNPKL